MQPLLRRGRARPGGGRGRRGADGQRGVGKGCISAPEAVWDRMPVGLDALDSSVVGATVLSQLSSPAFLV